MRVLPPHPHSRLPWGAASPQSGDLGRSRARAPIPAPKFPPDEGPGSGDAVTTSPARVHRRAGTTLMDRLASIRGR